LVTGRVWRGSAFGGARGRTDVPKIVDWCMEGKINIDDLITHTMPLDRLHPARIQGSGALRRSTSVTRRGASLSLIDEVA
jgi:Zn-dependent alcohol dehydrogenase